MNKVLLRTTSTIVTKLNTAKKLYLVLIIGMIGMVSNAQCIGPYQGFESFKSTTPTGWTYGGATSFTNTSLASQTRSGTYLLQQTGNNSLEILEATEAPTP